MQNQISLLWRIIGSKICEVLLRTIEGICRPNIKNYLIFPLREVYFSNNQHYVTSYSSELSPLVTQIKFYIPSENLFYGYCNEVKYHCSWNLQSNQILALDETTYNDKSADSSKVSAINLDDKGLYLSSVQSFSQDNDIGCKFYFFQLNVAFPKKIQSEMDWRKVSKLSFFFH